MAHGFGLYGKVDRVLQLPIVIGVWAVILVVSPIWFPLFLFRPAGMAVAFAHYRQMEPFKRKLEYRRRVPMPPDAPLLLSELIVRSCLFLAGAIALVGGTLQFVLGQPDTTPRLDKRAPLSWPGVYFATGRDMPVGRLHGARDKLFSSTCWLRHPDGGRRQAGVRSPRSALPEAARRMAAVTWLPDCCCPSSSLARSSARG